MMNILSTANDLCECQWDAWEIMPARFAAGAVGMTKVKQTIASTDTIDFL